VTLAGQARTAAEHEAVVSAAWISPDAMAVIDQVQVTTG
jgi:hypothetical protein